VLKITMTDWVVFALQRELDTGDDTMKIKRTFTVEITVNAELTQEVYDEAPTLAEWEDEVRKVIEQNLIHTEEDGVTYGLEITSKEDVSE
jgi:hypothetical protein